MNLCGQLFLITHDHINTFSPPLGVFVASEVRVHVQLQETRSAHSLSHVTVVKSGELKL